MTLTVCNYSNCLYTLKSTFDELLDVYAIFITMIEILALCNNYATHKGMCNCQVSPDHKYAFISNSRG